MQTTTLTIATRNDPVIFTTPARFAALRARGLYFPAWLECKAMYLAEHSTYSTRLPGIYKCGGSIVDTWRAACSCKAHRTHPEKPCVHQLAVWIGTLFEVWRPKTEKEIKFLAALGSHMPHITGFMCSLAGRRGRFYMDPKNQPQAPWYLLKDIKTGKECFAPIDAIIRLTPIYEEKPT